MNLLRTISSAGRNHRALTAGLVLGVVLSAQGNAVTPSGGTYVMPRDVIAGGGGPVSGGTYNLVGTVGQAAAGGNANGGNYQLTSGFHTPRAPVAPMPDAVFRDSFE